jgi:hypothetical protein
MMRAWRTRLLTVAEGEASFSPNSQQLAIVQNEHTTVWQPGTGAQPLTLSGVAPIFSPDGRLVVTRRATALTIWQLAGGAERFSLPLAEGATTQVAFSADSNELRVLTPQTVDYSLQIDLKIWSTVDRRALKHFVVGQATAAPDGELPYGVLGPAGEIAIHPLTGFF